MTDSSIARVRYYDQQILRTSDFVDEQAYHLAQRRRHNIGGHIWGIVYGLELAQDSNGELSVQPGMAIDGYGRELILEHYQPIEARIFDEKGSETLDVYLEYAEQTANEAPPGYNGCRDGQNSGNRVQETVRLVIRKAGAPQLIADIDLPERRQPEGVPHDDLRFSPDRVPPNDPGRRWPVFLGQLRRGAEPPISLGGRPYAGLRGEMVLAPSDWAWLQVGEWPDNNYHFGVFLADPDEDGDKTTPKASPRRFGEPILGIIPAVPKASDGAEPEAADAADKPPSPTIELRADTTLSGDLLIEGGAIEFGPGLAYTSPHPWRIYHVFKKSDVLNKGDNDLAQDELRIEMAAPDEQGTISEVVVGHWSEEKKDFVPCLTVGADCNVTVDGNLVVNGELLRFDKADASNVELVRYVVRRTQITVEEPVPVWFGALIEELNKKPDKLLNLFLTTLVKKVQELGLLDVLVAELVKSDYRSTFLSALAQQVKNDSAVRDALLKVLGDLVKTDATVRDALLKVLAQQVKNDSAVRDALLKMLGELVETDATVRDALLKMLGELVENEAAVRDALLKLLGDQVKNEPAVRDALLKVLGELVETDATVRDALLKLLGDQVKNEAAVRDALVDLLADKDAAQAILQPLVRKIWEEQAGDSKQRATFFADTLLGDLAKELPGDTDLRAALVAAIKAQAGLAQTLCNELVPPPPTPPPAPPHAPAGAALQHFIDQLHDDAQFRKRFANMTKKQMMDTLMAFPRS